VTAVINNGGANLKLENCKPRPETASAGIAKWLPNEEGGASVARAKQEACFCETGCPRSGSLYPPNERFGIVKVERFQQRFGKAAVAIFIWLTSLIQIRWSSFVLRMIRVPEF
jgi:hypothetical protein